MGSISHSIKFWIKNSRIKHAAPQSVLPAILAIFLAAPYPDFSLPLALLAVVGVILGHAAGNLFDDYFDYIKKSSDFREELRHKGFRARIGKCPYLTSGATDVKTLLKVAWMVSAAAMAIGLILLYYRGIGILYFIIIAGILIISYSGAPLRLSYRGMGELLIGVMFGPLNMIGVFYVACGTIDMSIVLISIPVGLLVANILYVHSILDYEPDKEVGKHTLAVLLDNKKWMIVAQFIILFAPYATIAFGIVAGYLPAPYWWLMLTLPMAIYLFYMMLEYTRNPKRQFTPHRWMGPLDRWKEFKTLGIDWFMIRWMVARNLLSSFCIITILITLINLL